MKNLPLLVLFARAFLGLLTEVLLVSTSPAQPARISSLDLPHVLIVTPAGGKASSSFEVELQGTDLDEPKGLLFSHAGITAVPIREAKPGAVPGKPLQGQAQGLMNCRFKVVVSETVPGGIYDVRLVNRAGASNPRAFVIGDLPEMREQEPNNDVGQAQLLPLNSTVHGTISQPTDVDYYRFTAKKGQRVVCSCLTSSIDSRLSAMMELYSSTGSILAFSRHPTGSDALLDGTLAADGEYFLRVFSSAYQQGGVEHFYRLTVSTAPWIDAVFPSVVEPGKPARLTVYGRNLPGGTLDPPLAAGGSVLEKKTVTVDVPRISPEGHLAFGGHIPPVMAAVDGFEYRIRNAAGMSNPFLLTFAQYPVVVAHGDNDTAGKAQAVPVPCEIAGWIEKKNSRHWYAFQAKKGDIWSLELFGDRMGSPLDLFLLVRGPGGQTLTELDDNPEQVPNQFFFRSLDPPRYRLAVPKDGTYLVRVASHEMEAEGGPRHLYRLRLAPERPDFHLIVMPPSPNAPEVCAVSRGSSQIYTIFVRPTDGFQGEIALSAEGLPAGVVCPPQTMSAGLQEGVLVVSAAANAPLGTAVVRVKGTATIDGKKVVREARPATITWPMPPGQNSPTPSRLDRSLVLGVVESSPFHLNASPTALKATQGDRAKVTLKLVRTASDFRAPVQVRAHGLPPTLLPQPLTIAPNSNQGDVVLNVGTNVAPGVYTFALCGQAEFPAGKSPSGRPRQNVTVVQPTALITLTVVAKKR